MPNIVRTMLRSQQSDEGGSSDKTKEQQKQ